MPRPSLHAIGEDLLGKFNNTCQSYGITGVPLELSHIVPASEGGTQEINNLTILCNKCNSSLGNYWPREIEFNSFLRDVLTTHPDYRNVTVEPVLGRHARADLTAIRSVAGKDQFILIESKSRSFLRHHQVVDSIAQIDRYRSLTPFDAAALAFPGRISTHDQAALNRVHIEVWDLDYIADAFANEIKSLSPSRLKILYSVLVSPSVTKETDILLQRLRDCVPGKDGWVEYQSVVKDIFEFLFAPPLNAPIWESSDKSGANRRDTVFPNYTNEGFGNFT